MHHHDLKIYIVPLRPPTATNSPSFPVVIDVNCFSSGNLSFGIIV